MTVSLSFDLHQATDQGRRRKDNQDSVLTSDRWLGAERRNLHARWGRLYIVADGVGGNDGGDVASRLVVNNLMQHFYLDAAAPDVPVERLRWAIERTTHDVFAEADARRNNMASTLVVALVRDGKATIANVGDSSAFWFPGGGAPQKLSTDHVRPNGDGLTQAMGNAEVYPAFRTVAFGPNDVLVLCSDGLTDLVEPAQIRRVIRGSSAKAATRELINLANRRGGHDNITALVLRNGKVPLWAQRHLRQWSVVGGGVLAACVVAALALPRLFAAPTFVEHQPVLRYEGAAITVPLLDPTTGLQVLDKQTGAGVLTTITATPPPAFAQTQQAIAVFNATADAKNTALATTKPNVATPKPRPTTAISTRPRGTSSSTPRATPRPAMIAPTTLPFLATPTPRPTVIATTAAPTPRPAVIATLTLPTPRPTLIAPTATPTPRPTTPTPRPAVIAPTTTPLPRPTTALPSIPTATTAKATNTPMPTNTPVPLPTNTPVPPPTNTPVPLPTNTLVPLPTNTPVPPTNTLVPPPIPIPPTPTPAPTEYRPTLTPPPTLTAAPVEPPTPIRQ